MSHTFTAISRATGEVLFSGTAHDTRQLRTNDVEIIDGVEYQGGYVTGGVHTPLPPKPTVHHVFDYAAKQWIDPRTPETEWPLVRAKRDRLIAATDWTQLPDVPLATKEMWANYRQALRDVTLQPDPFNIVWPVAP